MRLKQSLILLSSALSLMGSAVAASPQEAGNLAIQKTLFFTALLEKCPEGLGSDSLNQQALEFAKRESAPSEFIALLEEAQSSDASEQAVEELNKKFEDILAQYGITLETIVALSNNCEEPTLGLMNKLATETGTITLLSTTEADKEAFVAALPAEQRERESLAIKKSLMLYFLYMVENNSRISEADAAKCAELALAEGAPRIYAHLLQASSRYDISPNARYKLNELLTKLLQAYRIDRDNMRAYAEVCELSSEQITGLMKDGRHYLAESFNLQFKTKEEATLAEADTLSAIYLTDVRDLAEMLAGITPENAEQVKLARVAALIPSYQATNSIIHGRDSVMYEHLKQLGSNRLRYLSTALKVTQKELKRLFEQKDELPLALRALLIQFI